MMYVLDTSVVIDLLNGCLSSDAIPENPEVVISSITSHELMCGANFPKDEFVLTSILENVRILPFGKEESFQSSKLYHKLKSNMISANDLLIAGTCLTNGATIVTRDPHFNRVPGLKVIFLK